MISATEGDSRTDGPLNIFISKMMSIRVADLSKEDIAMLNAQRKQKATATGTDYIPLKTEDEIFMALGRVFSGILRRNSNLYIIGHKHDPMTALNETSTEEIEQCLLDASHIPSNMASTVSFVKDIEDYPNGKIGCYMLLGPSAYPAESVPAGNIVGIVGLDDYILKTATISSTWIQYPLKSITFQAKPMLKVAIEPLSHKDLKALANGLQSLYQYDPVVEIGMEDNGQHTMTCLGELHLDQCVKALSERFAKCEVKVSEPLVSFRESIIPWNDASPNNSTNTGSNPNSGSNQTAGGEPLPPPWSDIPGVHRAKLGNIRIVLESANVAITIKAFPLPIHMANALEKDVNSINHFDEYLNQSYIHTMRSHGSTHNTSFIQNYLDQK
jgi:ribosome assembly protein 1